VTHAVAPTGQTADATSWPPRWLAELERAHERLLRAARQLAGEPEPTFDLAPAATGVTDALVALYDAMDQRGDSYGGVQRALVAVAAARAALVAGDAAWARGAQATLDRATGHLQEAATRLGAVPPPPPPPPSELVASIDVPRLHHVERRSIAPVIRVSKPITQVGVTTVEAAKPATFAELEQTIDAMKKRSDERMARLKARIDKAGASHAVATTAPTAAVAEPPHAAGFAAELPLPVDPRGFVRARTRELVEEVSMVGLQRAPMLGDPWRAARPVEQRMFRAIDAVVSMAPTSLELLEELVLDAPVKDGSRVFGMAMTLGCVRGRDAVGAVERVLHEFEVSDPDATEQFGAALKLAPHDQLPLVLRTWLSSADPRHRAMAIDVLGYRGLAGEPELAAAAADEPMVAAAALPHLALVRRGAVDAVAEHWVRHEDLAVRRSAWLAMTLGGHPAAATTLWSELDGPNAREAGMLLAIGGDETVAQRLVERYRATTDVDFVGVLGWVGSGASIGALFRLLEQDDEELKVAAAWALERITGAGLWEQAEMAAEDIEVSDPPAPALPFPEPPRLVRMVSDPRDMPPEPAKDVIERPTTDRGRWQQFWKERGAELGGTKRYRRGRLYTPLVSLEELDEAACTPAERRWLAREIVVRSGSHVRFDPHDFVITQEQAIEAWRPRAQRSSSTPGTWPRMPLR
jgi:hypothetical protein